MTKKPHPNKGRKKPPRSPEHCRKLAEARRGKKHTTATKAKISAKKKGSICPMKGKKLTTASIAKMSASKKGKKLTAEHRASIASGLKGKKKTAKHRAALSVSHTGKKNSAEANEKNRQAHLGKTHGEKARRKVSIFHTGRKRPPETGRRISAAHIANGHGGRKDAAEGGNYILEVWEGTTFIGVMCGMVAMPKAPRFNIEDALTSREGEYDRGKARKNFAPAAEDFKGFHNTWFTAFPGHREDDFLEACEARGYKTKGELVLGISIEEADEIMEEVCLPHRIEDRQVVLAA